MLGKIPSAGRTPPDQRKRSSTSGKEAKTLPKTSSTRNITRQKISHQNPTEKRNSKTSDHEKVAKVVEGINFSNKEPVFNLLSAVKTGNVEIINETLTSNSTLKEENDWDLEPMILAAKKGNKRILKALSRQGADLHKIDEDSGNNLFHVVCNTLPKGTLKVIEFLNKKEVSSCHENKEGKKPYQILLEKAPMKWSDEDCIAILKNLEIKPDSLIDEKKALELLKIDTDSDSGFNSSSETDSDVDLMEIFTQQKAKKGKKSKKKEKEKEKELESKKPKRSDKAIEDKKIKIENPLLSKAVENGNLEEVKKIIQDSSLKKEDICYLQATFSSVKFGHLDILKFLFEKGADLNATLEDKSTLLHVLCEQQPQNTKSILEFLIKKKVNPQSRNKQGQTPLDKLVAKNCLDKKEYKNCLKILCKNNPPSHSKNHVIKNLGSVRHSSNPNDDYKINGLGSAIASNNKFAVKFLLDRLESLPKYDASGIKLKLNRSAIRKGIIASFDSPLNLVTTREILDLLKNRIINDQGFARDLLMECIYQKKWIEEIIDLFHMAKNRFDNEIIEGNTILHKLMTDRPKNIVDILRKISKHIKNKKSKKLNDKKNNNDLTSINILVNKIHKQTKDLESLKKSKVKRKKEKIKRCLIILHMLLSIVDKDSLENNFIACFEYWKPDLIEPFFNNGLNPMVILDKKENTILHRIMIECPPNANKIIELACEAMKEKDVIRKNKDGFTPSEIMTQKIEKIDERLRSKTNSQEIKELEEEKEELRKILDHYNQFKPKEKK